MPEYIRQNGLLLSELLTRQKLFIKRVKYCLHGKTYFITLKSFHAKQLSNLEF